MHVTLIHPAMGRQAGRRYLRSWQMEPLQPALLAALTLPGVELSFHDDRMEAIPFDAPTDLVAISVETYTARRAYQIASDYRRRGVPVAMGGFHATLCTEEVARFAETVVVGEAEGVWPELIDDARHGRPQPRYHSDAPPPLEQLRYDRSLYRGKRYLPVRLVEAGRGCRFRCEFCAIQSFFDAGYRARPPQQVAAEIADLRQGAKLFFFVDDNFAADLEAARTLARALAPLHIRWVTQMSIDAAHDEELLELLRRSGCMGVLIGFESTDPATLKRMGKGFNQMRGGYRQALANLRRHQLRVYGTFVFGYDGDGPEGFDAALELALSGGFYIAAFNHLTPFPGTPLYRRLEAEGRLLYDAWWLDPTYGYNRIPFRPLGMSAEALQARCLAARRRFYSLSSIAARWLDPVNRSDPFMWRNFLPINWMHRRELDQRNGFPLGDAGWRGELLEVQ